MAQTIIGLLLLMSPFLLITRFKDKKLGFAYILSFIISFQLLIAVLTQAFRVFFYPVILAINLGVLLAVLVAVLVKADFKKILPGFKSTLRRADWVLIIVLVTAFIYLASIHYNYTGKYTTTTTLYNEAKVMRYPYPYYSDEWYAIAFIQDSIDSHSLPIKNPLLPWRIYFRNLELPFHSFLSEIFLLLKLNPLVDFTKVTIFMNLTILLLIYLFLRQNKVDKLPTGIVTLSTLYITNGAVLPGIWYLLPLNIGIIAILLGLIFISAGKRKMMLFMAFITLLFYPPLFLFYTLALFVYIFTSKDLSFKKKSLTVFSYSLIVAIAGIIVSSFYFLAKGKLAAFAKYILLTKIYHPAFAPDTISRYPILDIVPIPVLLLATLGALTLLRKRIWLLSIILLGLAHWFLYSVATFRFIIEFERVIFSTSILLVIAAGFGLSYLFEILRRTTPFKGNDFLDYILAGALLLFLILYPQYTKRENWRKLTLYNFKTGETFVPEAPANQHLHPDDLELFKDIKNKAFLSIPWKGTVIGVATGNYPAITKAGTISIKRLSPSKFMNSDCNKKYEMVKPRRIEYVYLPEFDCPNFEEIGRSSEGLILYKVVE